MVYEWKRNMPVKAQEAGEHLENLEQKHGMVTPKLIVDDSRPQTAVLHKCFEWNDEVAAEKYRESQAGFVLRNLVTVSVSQKKENQESEIRAFVNVTKDDDRGFISINNAMQDEDLRKQLLENALTELSTFKNKYQQLSELAKLFEEINNLKMVV